MLSRECCSNPPVLDPNSGAGHVEKLAGLNTYISGSPDSKLAIVLVSDILGYEAPHLRELADKTAAARYFVLVPDFFYGDPYDPKDADRPLSVWLKDHGTLSEKMGVDSARKSIVNVLKIRIFHRTAGLISPFMTDKGFEDAKQVIEALKSKGFSAIGVSGFCWGGKVAVELAKSDFIQAVVLLHPALVTVEEIKAVKVPISILGGEFDQTTPPELVKQFEEVLAAKSDVDFIVKVFPNVSHGWTTRYSDDDEEAVKKAEEALQDMLEWFSKYIK